MKDYNHDAEGIEESTGVDLSKVMTETEPIHFEAKTISVFAEGIEKIFSKRELAVLAAFFLEEAFETKNELEYTKTKLKALEKMSGSRALGIEKGDIPAEFREQLYKIVESGGRITKEIAESIPGFKEFLNGKIKEDLSNSGEKDDCQCDECKKRRFDCQLKDVLGDDIIRGEGGES